jgi:agmatine deiminase
VTATRKRDMSFSRRQFVAGSIGALVLSGSGASLAAARRRMPDENARHRRTWMAFGAQREIWGDKLLPGVQQALGRIARIVARYEPVIMLARPGEMALARRMAGARVRLLPALLDDLWIRDTGPVFVRTAGAVAAVDFNFNGWGRKQAHGHDAKVAALVAKAAGVPRVSSRLVLEGGGIEVDGQGTAIVTESCVLNPNRNPGVHKAACEVELKRVLGVVKVIWLPGIAGRDITDGHTDFYARFTQPGRVLAALEPDPDQYDHKLMQEHLRILRASTDAEGRPLEVVILPGPARIRPRYANKDFAAGYINYYVANGLVLAPQFGDRRADAVAAAVLNKLYPGRNVIQLNVDAIAGGGGGIHCATQQEPW